MMYDNKCRFLNYQISSEICNNYKTKSFNQEIILN